MIRAVSAEVGSPPAFPRKPDAPLNAAITGPERRPSRQSPNERHQHHLSQMHDWMFTQT
jgi:hypothetical protein